MAKRPNEAAKMCAMYLLHAGRLREYSKGNKPVLIAVSTSSLLVQFKAWYGFKEFQDTKFKGTAVILEPCFVKKVILKKGNALIHHKKKIIYFSISESKVCSKSTKLY